MSADETQPPPKKPFYKKWWFWWCVVALLALIGSTDKKNEASDSGSASHSASSKRRVSSSDAREFVERRLASTVGNVVELRQVGNGVYGGFPTGDNIFTYDGTCWTEYGSKNVVIAVEYNGVEWFVRQVNIN